MLTTHPFDKSIRVARILTHEEITKLLQGALPERYVFEPLSTHDTLIVPPNPEKKRLIRNPATWGCMDNDGENQD